MTVSPERRAAAGGVSGTAGAKSPYRGSGAGIDAGGLALAVLALLAVWRADEAGSPFPPRTIAVVPFAAAADQHDLADGFAEEIVSRLSRNPKIAPP